MNPPTAEARYTVRLFEVDPSDPTTPPTRLPDREVAATDLDRARVAVSAAVARERRPLRSLSRAADADALVAYVLPPLPAPTPASPRTRRKRSS